MSRETRTPLRYRTREEADEEINRRMRDVRDVTEPPRRSRLYHLRVWLKDRGWPLCFRCWRWSGSRVWLCGRHQAVRGLADQAVERQHTLAESIFSNWPQAGRHYDRVDFDDVETHHDDA